MIRSASRGYNTNRRMASANPSYVTLATISSAAVLSLAEALPIATLSVALLNKGKSLSPSPIAAM